MPYIVSLHSENKLSPNIKYRKGFNAPQIFSTTVVNNGEFGNKNLYCDNTVSLGCGKDQQSAEKIALKANYIKITFDGKIVIGAIRDWEYINDNHIKFYYNVDAFMSALVSGFIKRMYGLCQRVNLDTKDYFTNLQSEPFSPSDYQRCNTQITENFNQAIKIFEGIDPTVNGIYSDKTRLILTVSPAIVDYLNLTPFEKPSLSFPQELKKVNNFKFTASDATVHASGIFRGTPLKFNHMTEVQQFISRLMGGCGFITKLPKNGYSNQHADECHSYITPDNIGGGNAYFSERNKDGKELESIRFINMTDFYNLYCLPEKFSNSQKEGKFLTATITDFKNTSNLHRFSSESHDKGKLLAYPYNYTKMVTANGDIIKIIPQTFYAQIVAGDTSRLRLYINIRFIGGDSPRLMGRIVPTHNKFTDPYHHDSICEWFTIRSYPSITLSINDSYNPQLQKDIANVRKLSAVYTNSVANSRLSNPFKQSYTDQVNGVDNGNSNRGMFGNIMGAIGQSAGAWNNILTTGTMQGHGKNNFFSDKNAQNMQNETNNINAENFLTAESTSIMGNDFLTQFSVPAVGIWDCGATDAELFAYCRYLEEFGTSCNCFLNPLTNEGNIFNGQGFVKAFNGKTFYQFSNIDVTGVMPNEWRANIKNLFESGVYLID